VPELLEQAIALWRECPAGLPEFGHTYTPGEQQARERELDRFLEEVQSELRSLPRSRSEREVVQRRISRLLSAWPIGSRSEGCAPRSAAGRRLLRHRDGTGPARAPPGFSGHGRRHPTGQPQRLDRCGLQILLGAEMRLTPSIFAYSMLYPATDNYMDDPAVTRKPSWASASALASAWPATRPRP